MAKAGISIAADGEDQETTATLETDRDVVALIFRRRLPAASSAAR